jgi:hypothetical protein
MGSLDEQVARLERSLRRQRVLTIIAVVLAIVTIGIAAVGRTKNELRARAFQLVNADGEMVAQLGVTDRGGPFLKFHVPENRGSVMVGSLGEDLAGLAVISGDDETLLNAATDRNGNPAVSLTHKGKKAMLSVGETRSPTLLMLGDPGLFAATSKYLWLKDPSGTTVFSTVPGGGPPPVEEQGPSRTP